MLLTSREHSRLMEIFERDFKHLRLDREPKELWARGIIYQSGEANILFDAFRRGYSFGKAVG